MASFRKTQVHEQLAKRIREIFHGHHLTAEQKQTATRLTRQNDWQIFGEMKMKMETQHTTIEPGQYLANLVKIIDLGHQVNQYPGSSPFVRKLMLTWEIHGAGKTRYGSLPTVSHFYSASTHKKATLRRHLEAWLGRELTNEEELDLNLSEWLGRSCLMDVAAKGKFPCVANLSPLPNGHAPVATTRTSVIFDLDAPDMAVFDRLSVGIRNMIEASPEWKNLHDQLAATAKADETNSSGSYGSIIPPMLANAMKVMGASV